MMIVLNNAKGNNQLAVASEEIDYVEEIKGVGELNVSTGKWDRVEHGRVHLKSGLTVDVTEKYAEILGMVAQGPGLLNG